ncbi:MAG: hypothetical protein JXR95_07525 [Deltaproteobacteria bacterium]|nr:hypothetical protein [Deltaproteobacteria bacterium]
MSLADNKNFQTRIVLLDQTIDKLRALYEQYFMGLEKFEPVTLRKAVKNELRQMRDNPPTNTAQKFMLNKVDTKMKTYEQYWNRVLREIEEGIYHRQLKRLKRQVASEGLSPDVLDNVRTKGELEAAMATLARLREENSSQNNTYEGVAETTLRKVADDNGTPSQGIDPYIRVAYEAFVRARLRTGESLEGITPERFQATLVQKIPIVKKAHKCESVEIKISIKDGKATLSFVPH